MSEEIDSALQKHDPHFELRKIFLMYTKEADS
jgi:hypothetical protein